MGIILASILTFFINKEDGNKYLACLLILYIIALYLVYTTKIASFEDYLIIYTTLNLVLCTAILVIVNKNIWYKISALSVVIPQLVYLLILHKPYLLSLHIPIWYLTHVDTYFIYGVFLLAYEQSSFRNLKEMKFKDKLVNAGIIYCLVIF